jgi:hypothetical protein
MKTKRLQEMKTTKLLLLVEMKRPQQTKTKKAVRPRRLFDFIIKPRERKKERAI